MWDHCGICSSVPRVWPSGTGPKTARKCWTLQHLSNLCEVVTLGHLVGCKCWVALKADIWGHGTVAMWQLVAGYKINNELRLFAEQPITELRKELSKAFEHMDEPFLEATHLAAGHVSALSRPTGWILHCYIRHDAPWLRHDTPLLPIFCQLSKSQSVWIQELRKNAKELPQVTVKDIGGSCCISVFLNCHPFSSPFCAFLSSHLPYFIAPPPHPCSHGTKTMSAKVMMWPVKKWRLSERCFSTTWFPHPKVRDLPWQRGWWLEKEQLRMILTDLLEYLKEQGRAQFEPLLEDKCFQYLLLLYTRHVLIFQELS